jgi:transcription antitermination factor NusG
VPTSYEIQDFVEIDGQNVGVIVKIEGENFTVLDQTNNTRLLKVQEIRNKRDSRRAVAVDSGNNSIKAGDLVRVLSGPYANRNATILHLYRSWAFLKTTEILENSGILVVRSNNVSVIGLKSNASLPSTPAGTPASNKFASPQSTPRGFSKGKRDPLVGKSVTISFGPFKGYKGIVKDANDQTARVELHTRSKILTVERDKLITEEYQRYFILILVDMLLELELRSIQWQYLEDKHQCMIMETELLRGIMSVEELQLGTVAARHLCMMEVVLLEVEKRRRMIKAIERLHGIVEAKHQCMMEGVELQRGIADRRPLDMITGTEHQLGINQRLHNGNQVQEHRLIMQKHPDMNLILQHQVITLR